MTDVILCILGLLIVAITVAVVFFVKYHDLRGTHETYKSTYTRTEADEIAARNHSVQTSRGAVLGSAAEHLAPFVPGMTDEFDPKDWRFLGSPVDFVVFDGLQAGLIQRVVLVEVKTGSRRQLTPAQTQIQALADAGALKLESIVLPMPIGTGSQLQRLARAPREPAQSRTRRPPHGPTGS